MLAGTSGLPRRHGAIARFPRDAGAFVEDDALLILRRLELLRPRDGRDEPRAAARLDDATGGRAVGV
jgi:hypothetical protein